VRGKAIDEAVQRYIDGIDPAFRPLFDQIHELVIAAYPETAASPSATPNC